MTDPTPAAPDQQPPAQPSPVGQRVDGEADTVRGLSAGATYDVASITPHAHPVVTTAGPGQGEASPLNVLLDRLARTKRGKHPKATAGAHGGSGGRGRGSWSERRLVLKWAAEREASRVAAAQEGGS